MVKETTFMHMQSTNIAILQAAKTAEKQKNNKENNRGAVTRRGLL